MTRKPCRSLKNVYYVFYNFPMLFPKYRRQSEQEIKIDDKQEISKARYIAIWMRMVGQEARSSCQGNALAAEGARFIV